MSQDQCSSSRYHAQTESHPVREHPAFAFPKKSFPQMPIASLFRSPPLGLYSESSDNSFQPPTAGEDGISLSGLHIEPFICGRVRLLMPDCRTSQQSLICMRRKRVQLELARQRCQMQTGQMWPNQWRSFHGASKRGVTTLFFVEHLAQATLKISRLAWLAATAWGT